MMTKDECIELFEVRVRGMIATAFAYRGISPGEYWPMIRGEKEITLRAIGEVDHITGFSTILELSERPDEPKDPTRERNSQ